MREFKYDYTIYPDYSIEKFIETFQLIEKNFPSAKLKQNIEDIDGNLIRLYEYDGRKIAVFNNFIWIGAVYVKSDIDLDFLFA